MVEEIERSRRQFATKWHAEMAHATNTDQATCYSLLNMIVQGLMPVVTNELIAKPKAAMNRSEQSCTTNLTTEEKQVLHYAAAYIPRKLKRKFLRYPTNKAALLYSNIIANWTYRPDENESLCSQRLDGKLAQEVTSWTAAKDRGGLLYCSPCFYNLMKVIEINLQNLVSVDNIDTFSEVNIVPFLVDNLKNTQVVLDAFHRLIQLDVTHESCDGLLDEVLTSWVFIRVNRIVKQFLCKQNQKGGVVSKMGTPALRKTLDKYP